MSKAGGYYPRKLKDIGIIEVENGFKIDQYNDDTIMVLTESSGVLR